MDLSAQEVDVAKSETERLTLTEPTASGDDADTSVPLRQGITYASNEAVSVDQLAVSVPSDRSRAP